MQFSYFYWNKNEKKGDEKKTLFRYCVMLLEKCIMGYYSLVVWFALKPEISKDFIFCQEKPFGETFSKITIKVSKGFFFRENRQKVKFYHFQSPREERRLKETSSSLAGK